MSLSIRVRSSFDKFVQSIIRPLFDIFLHEIHHLRDRYLTFLTQFCVQSVQIARNKPPLPSRHTPPCPAATPANAYSRNGFIRRYSAVSVMPDAQSMPKSRSSMRRTPARLRRIIAHQVIDSLRAPRPALPSSPALAPVPAPSCFFSSKTVRAAPSLRGVSILDARDFARHVELAVVEVQLLDVQIFAQQRNFALVPFPAQPPGR